MSKSHTKCLRIGYLGDGPWANRALKYIAEDSRFDIVFITPRYTNPDDNLKAWANRLGVPFLLSADVNSPNFLEKVRELKPDILLSMSFNQIVKREFIETPPYGAINCHAGALPFYRGRNPLNWALINGEDQLGITVHYIDEGIDTGDIIIQKFSPISSTDNYSDLLERAHELCAQTLMEALVSIYDGTGKRMPQSQISSKHTYFSRRLAGDELIDWSWSSERIHNFIRSITLPGPCAKTHLNEKIIVIVEAEMVNDVPEHIATNGEVIGRDPSGIIVKTDDTVIKITKIADILPDETMDVGYIPQLPIGSRFGLNLNCEIMSLRDRISKLEQQILKNI